MSIKRVLLVDDESVVRMTTALILKKLGAEAAVFAGGHDALSYFREHSSEIDLVIMDSHMPEMSGVELFHELKLIQPDVQAVLASGFLDDAELEQSISEGFKAVLNKPFSIQDVKNLLDSL